MSVAMAVSPQRNLGRNDAQIHRDAVNSFHILRRGMREGKRGD